MATFSARKVKDYDLYSGHAWYVPGVKGMFGFIGWFLLGGLLGGIVQAIMGLFMSQQAVLDYGMIVVYPPPVPSRDGLCGEPEPQEHAFRPGLCA